MRITREKLNSGRLVLIISVVASIITSGGLAYPNSMSFTNLLGLNMNHEHEALSDHEAEATPLPRMIDDLLKQNLKAGDAVNNRNLKIEEDFIDPDNHCEFCQRYEYTPGSAGRAGIAYEYDNGRTVDLSGAKKVFFFAMGEEGGEKLKFKVAGRDANLESGNENGGRDTGDNQDSRESDRTSRSRGNGVASSVGMTDDLFPGKAFAKTTDEVSLTDDWKRYEIDLADVDLASIENPFAIEALKSGSAKQVFYVKGITFDTEPATDPLPTAEISETTPEGNLTASNRTQTNATNDIADSPEMPEEQADNNTSTNTTESAADQTPPATTDSEDNNESSSTQQENDEENDPASATGNGSDDTGPQVADSEPTENERPVATILPDEILAHPGDRIILDATATEDPDADNLSFSWEPKDSEIEVTDNSNSPTPTVTVSPDINEDKELSLELIVSDGDLESKPHQVTIVVDYYESAEPPDGASEAEESILRLAPLQRSEVQVNIDNAGEVGSWKPNGECLEEFGDSSTEIGCLGDNSDDTFVSADGQSGDVLLFEPSRELDSETDDEVFVNYISAEIEARSSPGSGSMDVSASTAFVSLVVFDEDEDKYYFTPAISITSDSFETYSYRWPSNPNENIEWHNELEQPLLIGYVYSSGTSGVEISEFTINISYYATPAQADVEAGEEDNEVPGERSGSQQVDESDDSAGEVIEEEPEQVDETSMAENATSESADAIDDDAIEENSDLNSTASREQ